MSTFTGKTELVRLDDRIGVDISKAVNFDEVMSMAGFDFDVEKVPTHTPEGDEVPGHFLIRRSDTKQNFAVMRRRYAPIPMDQILQRRIEVIIHYQETLTVHKASSLREV